MGNQFLIGLAILAQLTGLTLPQVLEEGLYTVPSYTGENYFYWAAQEHLPEVQERYLGPAKTTEDLGPDDLEAEAAMVMDKETGKILYQKNPDEKLSIASITKLMTVLVFLDHQPGDGLEHVHTLDPGENSLIGASLKVDNLEKVRTYDLLRSTLVGSTNNGAIALAHSTEMSNYEFIEAMNDKAKDLGMDDTTYAGPTGLRAGNVSTVRDLMKVFNRVLEYEELAEPMGMSEHYLATVEGEREVKVTSTNDLLKDKEVKVTAGKTGFTYEAGYCLIAQAENDSGKEIYAVVLGEDSDYMRQVEMKELINWTFNNYKWN